jgi:hypothetical protein
VALVLQVWALAPSQARKDWYASGRQRRAAPPRLGCQHVHRVTLHLNVPNVFSRLQFDYKLECEAYKLFSEYLHVFPPAVAMEAWADGNRKWQRTLANVQKLEVVLKIRINELPKCLEGSDKWMRFFCHLLAPEFERMPQVVVRVEGFQCGNHVKPEKAPCPHNCTAKVEAAMRTFILGQYERREWAWE